MKVILGAHFPYTKDLQIYGVISDAIELGANAGSFHISNTKSYTKIDQDVDGAHYAEKLAKNNELNLENFIVKAPTIGNLATNIEESNVYAKTYSSYLQDLKQMYVAKLKYFVFKPGSSKDKEEGIKNIAQGINDLHADTLGDGTVILMELLSTYGHDVIGTTFEELKQIIDLVHDKERVGICMDTCLAWTTGYDVRDNFNGVLEELDEVLGLEYLKALFISDSKSDIGSQKNMHEQVGLGTIGERSLYDIVHHPKLGSVPKIIDTSTGARDYTKYKDEFDRLSGE